LPSDARLTVEGWSVIGTVIAYHLAELKSRFGFSDARDVPAAQLSSSGVPDRRY
jgi:hypothetical protein